MSPFTKVYLLLFSISRKFAGLAPVPILSKFNSSMSGCSVSMYLQKLLPMKPKPPVTRSFMLFHLWGGWFQSQGLPTRGSLFLPFMDFGMRVGSFQGLRSSSGLA